MSLRPEYEPMGAAETVEAIARMRKDRTERRMVTFSGTRVLTLKSKAWVDRLAWKTSLADTTQDL